MVTWPESCAWRAHLTPVLRLLRTRLLSRDTDFPRVVTAPSAGGLEEPSCGYLDMARAVTAGLVLLGFPVKATLMSSSLHRARFFSHLWPVGIA